MPPLAAGTLEAIIFRTSHFFAVLGRHAASALPFASAVEYRHDAFSVQSTTHLPEPGVHVLAGWLGSWPMWIGVAIGIVFVAATVMIRRYRDEA